MPPPAPLDILRFNMKIKISNGASHGRNLKRNKSIRLALLKRIIDIFRL